VCGLGFTGSRCDEGKSTNLPTNYNDSDKTSTVFSFTIRYRRDCAIIW
jgi:hypothetical protein